MKKIYPSTTKCQLNIVCFSLLSTDQFSWLSFNWLHERTDNWGEHLVDNSKHFLQNAYSQRRENLRYKYRKTTEKAAIYIANHIRLQLCEIKGTQTLFGRVSRKWNAVQRCEGIQENRQLSGLNDSLLYLIQNF